MHLPLLGHSQNETLHAILKIRHILYFQICWVGSFPGVYETVSDTITKINNG